MKMQDEANEKTGYNSIDSLSPFIYDIFGAGLDTTLAMLLLLLVHPEYGKKIQYEIDTVIGRIREPQI